MFRYKLCKTCKYFYKLALAVIVMWVLLINWMISSNIVVDFVTIIIIIFTLCPSIIASYYHYKEHQKEQFNKIKNKFGVK